MEPELPDLFGVYFLDVGQGDCTVLVPPEGGAIIFDIRDQYVAERFVANHQLELRAVVASHLDSDHIGGMLGFLRGQLDAGKSIDRLYLGLDRLPKRGANSNLRALVEQAIEWAKTRPTPPLVVKDPWRDGDGPLTIAAGDDWSVQLVLPFNYTRDETFLRGANEPNVCSAVLRVERAGKVVLIGGDATLGSWETLDPELVPAHIFRVPHHGGDIRERGQAWTRSRDLYDRVGAELGVISVGTHNGHEHPLEDHVEAIRRGGACRLLCTQLTPRCHAEPTGLRDRGLEHAASVEFPYRHWLHAEGERRPRPATEVPCAGTVVAWIDKAGNVTQEPSPNPRGAHGRFLQRVDAPMCLRAQHSEP